MAKMTQTFCPENYLTKHLGVAMEMKYRSPCVLFFFSFSSPLTPPAYSCFLWPSFYRIHISCFTYIGRPLMKIQCNRFCMLLFWRHISCHSLGFLPFSAVKLGQTIYVSFSQVVSSQFLFFWRDCVVQVRGFGDRASFCLFSCRSDKCMIIHLGPSCLACAWDMLWHW